MWACFWIHFRTPLKNGSGHFFMILGVLKLVQKDELISVLGVHGAPWAPKSVFGPESCISTPPKVTPRRDNRLKNGTNVVQKVFPNLARRTARSGLNKAMFYDSNAVALNDCSSRVSMWFSTTASPMQQHSSKH